MPPLNKGGNRNLELEREREQLQPNPQSSTNPTDGADTRDLEFYDFGDLRNNLDEYNDAENADNIGDLLVEEGDDLNDETFGDEVVGKDFDFAANTERFSSAFAGTPDRSDTMITEEEAFFVKQPTTLDATKNKADGWRMPEATVPIGRRADTGDFRGSRRGEGVGTGTVNSIWGGFGDRLPNDRSFGSFQSNGNFSIGRQHQPVYAPSPPPGLSPSASFGQQQHQSRGMRIEDIAADLLLHPASGAYKTEPDGRKVMSLSEVEATMLTNNGRDTSRSLDQHPLMFHQAQAFHNPSLHATDIGNAESLRLLSATQEEQLAKHQKEEQLKARYDGLMTQHEKDFISRIQLTQLASSDPFSDDFYYQVYSSLRQRVGIPTWSAAHEPVGRNVRGRKEESGMQRFHQQLQRVVNNAKKNPRQTQVSLEGALGKITSLTVRNPRQVLEVTDKKSNNAAQEGSVSNQKSMPNMSSMNDRKRTLKIVENLYLIVLDLEQLRRQGTSKTSNNQENDAQEWNNQYASKTKKLYDALGLSDQSDESSTTVLSLLSVAKGMKLVPRIIRHFNTEENLALVSAILGNFSHLNVCRNVIYPGSTIANVEEARTQKFVSFDEVELFINTVAPPLLNLISESSLKVVNYLMRLFVEKNDIVSVARTKPGLAFLTMILSRAEILKQGDMTTSADDMHEWQQEYVKVFNTLKNHYSSLFPSTYYLVPMQPNVTAVQLSLTIDEMYVWQFLAAMAVGATMEQQHALVTEVRERVMENIVLAHSNRLPAAQAAHRISNVNLFLHALGLDSSQVLVPR
ncbi:hypothetical protein K492DRAFT_178108 [Lichtheimia hyalospora FSU 10163]|nr:hypothetical protein K492DRAFT_178108 [Lichtheimia hyalospora FSU 10163]